jgi:uncharacterized protein YlxP (DUF503 family)
MAARSKILLRRGMNKFIISDAELDAGDQKGQHREGCAMAIKSWDQQTTDEKLDTLRRKLDTTAESLERLERGIVDYSRQVKKQFEEIKEAIKNLQTKP